METGRVTPSRVTRSQHKHLQSESDNSSRPGTPVSTQSLDISPKDTGLRRTTRRLSTSTPSKLMGKLVKEGTPEVSTPSKRITRRNSTSIIEVDVQKSVKTPKFPTLAEEDVNSEKPKYGEKTRRKSISPKLRSQSDKISATTSRFTRSALKIEAESKIKTNISKKKDSPLKRKVYSNDVEDSEVEIININTDEDSQSSVIDVKIDKNAKKTIKGKKQKTSDEEKKDIKNSEVVKNNVKDTVKSTEEEEEETKDMKKPDSIANDKNSINIEEAAIEQPVEKKVYGEEIDLTEDNENSFKADENQSKEKSNKVFHNESGEVKIKVEHNESDVEMIEIDEGVVGIDIKKEQEDEGKNIGNDDKDIEMIKENVGEHKKENIKINDTIMTNNVVINVTNTDAVIINGNKNIDPNTEPQALNKSLNELNVNKSYNDDVEIISHDLVIKDVLVNEIVSDSKVSNTDLNKNNSILEASNIQVPNSDLKNDNNILESSSIDMPNTDLQKNNSILETSNIEMPNTDQKNNSILEASNIEVPNTDLQKNNSILEANNIEVTNTDPQKNNSILEASNIEVPDTDLQKNNNILEASNIEVDLEQNESTSNENDCENDLNIRNVSLKLNDMKKTLNSIKINSPCTVPIQQTSKPSTPLSTMKKLKVMITDVRTLESTSPDPKINETVLDKTSNSNKINEEPQTPDPKIKKTLLDKTSNSNKKNKEPTTPDPKIKETLLDKTLNSNKKDEEPTTPDPKIKKTLLDKTLNSNKKNIGSSTPDKTLANKSLPLNIRSSGHRNSVTFDNSDDNDVEKKTYPRTPSLLKSKSYIEIDSSKSDLEEKKQDSHGQLPLLEVTPIKYKVLDKLKSSTPIINSANKVTKTKDELKQIDLEIEKSITLNSTAEKSCANSIDELVEEKSSPKKNDCT